MLLSLYNLQNGSGNPASLTGLAPGGAGVAVALGSNPVGIFITSPKAEQIIREVLDVSQTGGVATPAPQGSLLVCNPVATNPGGGQFVTPTRLDAVHLRGQYGIVLKAGSLQPIDSAPAGSGVGGVEIVTEGPVYALCTAPGAVAIAPNTLLASDGQGNLTPIQGPSPAPTPTVTPQGTAGAVTYSYRLVAVNASGVGTALGTAGTTTTGNAVLSNANYNQISWAPAADAAYYIIVRSVSNGTPNTTGTIGTVSGDTDTFNDTGLAIATGTTATQPYETLPAPAAPTVTPQGPTGTANATWSYKVSAILANGIYSAESTAGSTTVGNPSLAAPGAQNLITWTNVTGAIAYAVDRTVSGGTPASTGLIGTANNGTVGFIDYGQAATTFAAVLTPSPTPPAGVVVARSFGSLPAGTTAPTMVPVFVGGA